MRRFGLHPMAHRSAAVEDWPAIQQALDYLDELVLSESCIEELRDTRSPARETSPADRWKDPEAAREHIKLAKALYSARRLSRPEYVFLAASRVEAIHEARWTDGRYDSELGPISRAMHAIERSHGLGKDDFWYIGESPQEYRRLDAQYGAVLKARFGEALREFDLGDLADLLAQDAESFASLRERGRRATFHPGERVHALRDVVTQYEDDARLAAAAHAYSAAIASLGSAVEGLLLLRCLSSPSKALRIARSLPKPHRTKLEDPLQWGFDTLIEVSNAAGWLPPLESPLARYRPAGLAHFLRDLRNYVHPGRVIRQKPWWLADERDYEDAKAIYAVLLSTLGRGRRGSRSQSDSRAEKSGGSLAQPQPHD